VLLERGALDSVNGAKSVFKRRSGTQASQLGLYHRAQVSRRMVAKFDYTAGLAFKNYDHAPSDLRCWYCHYGLSLSDYFCGLTDVARAGIANDVV